MIFMSCNAACLFTISSISRINLYISSLSNPIILWYRGSKERLVLILNPEVIESKVIGETPVIKIRFTTPFDVPIFNVS